MPTLTIPNSFTANTTAQSALVNANFNAVATLLNSTKLDSTNVQTGGLATANLADVAVTTAKIADLAVTTGKIADSSVTVAKLAAAVTALITPSGMITPYGGTSAPTGWLLCNGASVSRTTYADLFTVVSTAFGDGSLNADGSSSGNGSSTHFNLPDARGRFIRGLDGTAGRDPDDASRTAMLTGGNTGDNIGSVQPDGFKAHTHRQYGPQNAGGSGPYGLNTGMLNWFDINVPTETTGGNETRPTNIYLNHIIKT